MVNLELISGNKSLRVKSKALFNIKPTALFSVNSVIRIIDLLNELSFNIEGSATSNFPLVGLITLFFYDN
tara:strand:- start:526 stop:735 length:210 start_codon:yes stop_codon:yes gene_type:complete